MEHVLAGERARPLRVLRPDGVPNRSVLRGVQLVELVEPGSGSPDSLAEERSSLVLRELLDERRLGRGVDDVVEGMVGPDPVGDDPPVLRVLVHALQQPFGQAREALLRGLQRRQVGRGHPRCRELRREAFELRANEERLAQLLTGERPHADAPVRRERDESERRQPPQGLSNGRSANGELLGQLLLAKDGARRELSGDDRLLQVERDVVGLRAGAVGLIAPC